MLVNDYITSNSSCNFHVENRATLNNLKWAPSLSSSTRQHRRLEWELYRLCAVDSYASDHMCMHSSRKVSSSSSWIRTCGKFAIDNEQRRLLECDLCNQTQMRRSTRSRIHRNFSLAVADITIHDTDRKMSWQQAKTRLRSTNKNTWVDDCWSWVQ